MFILFLSLLIIDSLLLGVVILLQAGQGGGLAGLGGGASTDTFLGSRQATTVLTKMSWWTGGIFLGLSLILAAMSSRSTGVSSVLEGAIAPPPVSTAPLPIGAPTTPEPGAAVADTN